jgi:Tol biopolymer transport system component
VTTRLYSMPPSNLPGTLLAWGDVNPGSPRFLKLFTVDPRAGNRTLLNERFVRLPSVDGVGSRFAYLRIDLRTNDVTIDVISGNNPSGEPTVINTLFGLTISDPDSPSLSTTGNFLAFVAVAESRTKEVFLWRFLDEQLIQLTRDGSQYTGVAVSPDGRQIVAVKEDPAGTDLVLLDNLDRVSSDEPVPQILLTNDRNGIVESSPIFASDGQRIVYSGGVTPDNNDIYTMSLDNFAVASVIATQADEIYPHFGPDNRYIVYSANPTGVYNLFIFDPISQATFQLTEETRAPFAAR